MGLHFIKNGTKHDVCVKRPSLFPASATTYDNSNSGLSATRVQGAIDELANGTIKSVTYTAASYTYTKGVPDRLDVPLQPGETSVDNRISAIITNDKDFIANVTAEGRVSIELVMGGSSTKTEAVELKIYYI